VAQQRLAFIRRAQQLGFSLEEVRQLLDFAARGAAAEVRGLAEQKLAVVATQLQELQKMHDRLDQLVARSRGRGRGEPCPILEALQSPDAKA
jgi:MerR family mercuric resistance operon transcriptional regulator